MNKETIGGIIFLAIVALIGLHAWIAFSSQRELAGFLKEKPSAGYVWNNSQTQEPKSIFNFGKITWQSGQIHQDGFHVYSSSKEGFWYAMPGYKLMDTIGFNTAWEPMQKHPTQQARASQTEGEWIPELGYEFEKREDGLFYTVWKPNTNYEKLHITSDFKEGYFAANPGYEFSNPNESLEVKWVEGKVNPYNSEMISGYEEGTWVENGYDAEESDVYSKEQEKDHYVNALGLYTVAKFVGWLSGNQDNWVSNNMLKVSEEQFYQGAGLTANRILDN